MTPEGIKKKRVSVGDRIPDFTLKDQDGNEVSTEDILGRGPVVLYFYPKDETPGCTKEACYFRDQYEAFTDEGAQVIGVSSDSVGSHKKFAEHYNLPFKLLADEGGKLRKEFRVPSSAGILPGRVTYIIDKDGIVRMTFSSQLNLLGHIQTALEKIRSM